MRLRLGTRPSPLARAQAELVAAKLRSVAAGRGSARVDCEIVAIETTGDRIRDRPLREAGGKALFVKELDEAVLAGRVDCAVHSLKDVPSDLPDALALAAVPERADPRDALVSMAGWSLEQLPAGARVGTSSLRRAVLLRLVQPRAQVVAVRGNVGTRLEKLRDGAVDALLLAAAGLGRLGLELAGLSRADLDPASFVPAPTQGALGVTARRDDADVIGRLRSINDAEAALSAAAERALARVMGGSCFLPLGAYAARVGSSLRLRAVVASEDASRVVRDSELAELGDGSRAIGIAERLGVVLGRRMLAAGADRIIAELPA